MKVYQLLDPAIVGVEVHPPTDQDGFDDFCSTPPVLGHKRPNPDVGPSTARHSKRSKSEIVTHQTLKKIINQKRTSLAKKHKQAEFHEKPSKYNVNPKSINDIDEKAEISKSEQDDVMLLRQDIMIFKKSVDNQFTDILKLINDHFAKIMKSIKAKSHLDTEIIDSKGANSEVPPNMMDGSNERRGQQHVAPQSGNESGDTLKPHPRRRFMKEMKPDVLMSTRILRSSYMTDFDFASASAIILTPIIDKKHPFENALILGPHDNDLLKSYAEWINEGCQEDVIL
ncbi:hypothetical protein HAX54_038132 [Datura stramonium]|uniref:Uncharacterized protein n=1 Tax=Datura stramonium TaxID=4076 RepID=A0ABS8VKU6_DATST|nr:hypothetical protein [Datura stramonium]